MREILFRGKTENGVWVEGFYIESEHHNDRNLYRIVEKDNWCDEYEGYYYNEYDVIPETVGQFTGLTDRNGNRIFEGDIVEIIVPLKDTKPIIKKCKVYFCERGFCVKWQTNNYSLSDFAPCVEIEVIGNIHDNPELISGDSNAD